MGVSLTFDEGFDELDNLALLMPWQSADPLEDPPDLAGRSALPGGLLFDAEQMLHGDVENHGKAADLIRAQRDVVAFPCGITGLLHAEFFGDLRLRQAKNLPRLKEALAERRPRSGRWSTLLHAVIIRQDKKTYRFCLHV